MARKHAWVYAHPKWKALCEQVHEEETHCRICRQIVDKRYHGRHPKAPSVHHLVDLDLGGEPFERDNVGLTHYGCNSRLGASQGHKTRAAVRQVARGKATRGQFMHVPKGRV